MSTVSSFTTTTSQLSSTAVPREIYMHVAGVVFLALLSLYGTIGNIFIIGAVSLKEKLRVRGNAFVINLAIADLIVCAYIMPLGLVSSQYSEEPFGSSLCDFNAFLLMTSCGVSTQTLMMIGIERYFHVCKVTWYRRFFTPTLIAVYITIIWIYTCIWTVQGLTGWSRYVYGQDVWLCIVEGPYSLSYNICLSLFGMILPMMVLSFCYFMIFRMVYKSRKKMKKHRNRISAKHGPNSSRTKAEMRKEKKEFRLILMLFTIVVVFCVFWLPASIVIIFSSVWESMPKILYTVAMWMALSNSAVNSIIYGVMNQNFRDGYLIFFNKVFCSCMDEKRQLECKWCRRIFKREDESSTSASQSQTTNVHVISGDSSKSDDRASRRRRKPNATKETTLTTHAPKSNASEDANGVVLVENSNEPKVSQSQRMQSRPSTVKTVRSVTEVTVRSESKISLRSTTSLGSMDGDSGLASIEGPSRGTEALLNALDIPMNTAIEAITGEEEGDSKTRPMSASSGNRLFGKVHHGIAPINNEIDIE